MLGVLVILAIIALITIPIIDKSLENSRESAYDRTVDSIVNAAENYSTANDLGYPTEKHPLFVGELQDEGFLELNIKSPIDETEMGGCVWYYWDEDHKQYIFEYDNECIIEDPSIDIIYNASLINSNGWTKENIAATLVGTGKIKYCISNSECEPTEEVINGANTKFITNEGINYICASSTNVLGESTSLCKSFKLDKTAPTISGLELITVDKDETVDLNTGVKVDDNLSGIDGTYTITPNTVDTSTAGTKTVSYSVSDMAGNTTTINRTIKVISEPPVTVFNVEGNPFNSNNWSKENVTIRINVTDNSGLGIKEIKYCKGTTDCEPTTTIENNGTVVLEENSATNKVCVIATDNNNTSSKICSNNYQIDKVLPIIDGIGDIEVNRNDKVDLTSGVTYSDALSQIDGTLTITPSTVDTSTIGTKQVTYKVVDKAGNVREVVRNIIVDANAPTIVFNLVNSSAINNNGWAKSDFYLRATITDNSGTGIKSGSSCTTNSSSECTPVASFTGTTKDFLISVEGSNRACVQVTDNNNKTTKVCSNTYKLDKTAPVAGTATFTGTLGSNSWYTTNVTVNKVNGTDALSGHSSTTSNISSITSNTSGTMITITTTDLAGNSSSRNYTIKVDKNSPTLTAKSSNVTITVGDSYPVANLYTVSYGISGGSVVCKNGSTTITNLSSLSAGTYTIKCTATGGNGKTRTVTKTIIVNYFSNDNSGANHPSLITNLVPVVYDGTNWIYSDGTQENWYNYNDKSWANAVVLSSGINKKVGDIINESEIALWYVWIPRYKYQLFNANNGSVSQQIINVVFENGINTTGTVRCTDSVSGSGNSSEICTNATNGNWYTHPAFTFGTEQVTGFWIGKFEVSGSVNEIAIKPGVQSLRNTTIFNFFTAIQNLKDDYNLSGDSHMIKSMEWGAVAYLKQSKYGLGITDIQINNSNYYTGGGNNATSYKNNIGQSTTGNIYGTYDMSGGAWEYVMGNMVNSRGSFYSNSAGFSTAPNTKYYDRYTYDSSNLSHSRGKLGDATKETLNNFGNLNGGWYNDSSDFLYRTLSWFGRGGNYSDGSSSGIFDFGRNSGAGFTYVTTRAVLID